ncbi:TRAP transporter small permease subunit [Peribacillus saganii]|uniref:TRAP transporter small permease subunit n=1 Tax=Peribacillus saganii TaxID=2303992 RepID=A0A372LPZ2_9BACI|nr:TRAP transporter small permease subunit [Peribacillus saganii]RFU70283.1 TRAP transporter small permease subunit [Peribacillus saganii]
METLVRIIDKINKVFAYIAGILMVLSVCLIITEILVRSVFNSTIYITTEYTAYFMAAITFLGLAFTLKEKGHIRMVFIYKIFKGNKARVILDLYSYIVGLLVFLIITIATFQFFWDSLVSGTQSMQLSKTYLAIPQFILPLGSFLVSLQFIAEISRTVLKNRNGAIENKEEDHELQAAGH